MDFDQKNIESKLPGASCTKQRTRTRIYGFSPELPSLKVEGVVDVKSKAGLSAISYVRRPFTRQKISQRSQNELHDSYS